MKKIISFLFLSLLLFSFNTVNAAAYGTDDDIKVIFENIDDETKSYLEELGIDEFSFEKLFSVNPTRFVDLIIGIFKESGSNVIKYLYLVIVVIIISSVASSFIKSNESNLKTVEMITSLIIISVIIVPVSKLTVDVAVSLKLCTTFVNLYLPVMTAIIVASKNPSLALTYNSFSLFLSSAITTATEYVFMPLLTLLLSFNILSSFSFDDNKNRIFKTIKKIIIVSLSLFSIIYTGLLSSQSLLSSSSDSLVLRGIKFISGAFIPIVGGNVGETLTSVMGSFSIMRNTFGIFIILVIVLINLPVMVELLIWYFALQISVIISSLFNLNGITEILENLCEIVSLINTVLFFITFVLVISTGIIITMRQ